MAGELFPSGDQFDRTPEGIKAWAKAIAKWDHRRELDEQIAKIKAVWLAHLTPKGN